MPDFEDREIKHRTSALSGLPVPLKNCHIFQDVSWKNLSQGAKETKVGTDHNIVISCGTFIKVHISKQKNSTPPNCHLILFPKCCGIIVFCAQCTPTVGGHAWIRGSMRGYRSFIDCIRGFRGCILSWTVSNMTFRPRKMKIRTVSHEKVKTFISIDYSSKRVRLTNNTQTTQNICKLYIASHPQFS